MAIATTIGLLRLTGGAVANAVQDRVSTFGKRLPPSPPMRNPWLGHLHEIRTEGFVAFHARCLREYGPLVMLRFGPPVLGRRFLVVADPDVARLTLTQDLQRNYPWRTGPRLVFGDESVFSTAAGDAVHARRRELIGRHLTPDMLRRHAAVISAIWDVAADRIAAIPPGSDSVERFGFNQDVMSATQDAALRCWMGVPPTPFEIETTLRRYFDTGNLLSEILFNTWFFVNAGRRVAALREAYAPLLERCLIGSATAAPHARFVLESLAELGWDAERAGSDAAYRRRLLAHVPVYQHLFTVLLPAMGSTAGIILFLLRQTAADAVLQEELSAELADADLIDDPRPPPLTAKAIRECLRLYPQAAGITRYVAEPRSYGGYFVPKGAYTFTHLHTLHRHACRHADPEIFDPARPPGAAGSWAGFSIGPLACTGRAFAELHIAVALKNLLGRYKLSAERARPSAHNDYRGSVTLQPDPFTARFSRR